MGLCMSVYVSFSCKLCLLSVYMWNRFRVFMSSPFFSRCRMLSVSSMVPYVCPVSRMCCVYQEVVLLVRMAGVTFYFIYSAVVVFICVWVGVIRLKVFA
jgi:hypothetical protein